MKNAIGFLFLVLSAVSTIGDVGAGQLFTIDRLSFEAIDDDDRDAELGRFDIFVSGVTIQVSGHVVISSEMGVGRFVALTLKRDDEAIRVWPIYIRPNDTIGIAPIFIDAPTVGVHSYALSVRMFPVNIFKPERHARGFLAVVGGFIQLKEEAP